MKEFLEPEIEIEKFRIEDILTTSIGEDDLSNPDNGIGWG